eukprot:CAMPEP_0168565340 /NCGR_PEP_ID=MMETSP0413-20121227/13782_1 /TAXON_ID=136452 /ORGANISM="Filamoeba nolandi, Strain NC-AS-23-1" /LENGTH=417 /DNA_ID=CAMNT_0008597183 /DNA_START=173 /DNA_END=1426 /DNA_ORIENTATION=-
MADNDQNSKHQTDSSVNGSPSNGVVKGFIPANGAGKTPVSAANPKTKAVIRSISGANFLRNSGSISVSSPSNNTIVPESIELRKRYETLIQKGQDDPQNAEKYLYEIRKLILLEGLPSNANDDNRQPWECSLRGTIWKLLLDVRTVDAKTYIDLVNKGQAEQMIYDKIRNDTFRTFKTSEQYHKRVPEKTLIRLLNAFINSVEKNTISYVQGMNAICAPFLYVMPELDAFFAFSKFAKFCSPLYFNPGIEGAFVGLELLDEILKLTDPDLYIHLLSKDLKAEMYAMPPILSFSGCTPPLEELLKLWDFLLAFGVHLNVVCVAAQILMIREDLLQAERPNPRTLPPLDANSIISVSIQLVRQLPEELYGRLVSHPFKVRQSAKKYRSWGRQTFASQQKSSLNKYATVKLSSGTKFDFS